MPKFRTVGIILHSANFSDWDRIITVFTKELGVVKFFFKGGNSQKRKKGASLDSLTRAEFVYSQGKSDFLTLFEIAVLDHNTQFRENFELLTCAFDIGRAISISQLPGKPAPNLYHLLLHFLYSLPKYSDFKATSASFKLKLLRHDGHFAISDKCSVCHLPLDEPLPEGWGVSSNLDKYIFCGEIFCKRHAPIKALNFSSQEYVFLKKLAFCRFLSEIQGLGLPTKFFDNIDKLFQQIIFHT